MQIERGVESAEAAAAALKAHRYEQADSLISEAWSRHHEAEHWLELARLSGSWSNQCAQALAESGDLIRRTSTFE